MLSTLALHLFSSEFNSQKILKEFFFPQLVLWVIYIWTQYCFPIKGMNLQKFERIVNISLTFNLPQFISYFFLSFFSFALQYCIGISLIALGVWRWEVPLESLCTQWCLKNHSINTSLKKLMWLHMQCFYCRFNPCNVLK